MPARIVSLRWFIAFVFSAVALAGSYTVSVIPPPTGFTGSGMGGINNSGQVAGYGFNGSANQAFIGSPSGSAAIPFPSGWTSSEGNGINNLGQVAGFVANGGNNQAFVGTVSGSTVLPLPTGWSVAYGNAINDSGQVAGFASNSVQTSHQAFIGTPAGVTLIPIPTGWKNSLASAINSSGQVAGDVTSAGAGADQAFIGTPSGSVVLPLPTGWGIANGTAINNSGQVAGQVADIALSGGQAFIGTTSVITLIPLPAGATHASASEYGCLNDAGVVEGTSDQGAWIWDASNGTRLLSHLVPSGWTISSAASISQNGLILGQGSFNGGSTQFVELVPAAVPTTPAPATGFLAITGLLFVFAWRAFNQEARRGRGDPD
jgi:hypothetical protein